MEFTEKVLVRYRLYGTIISTIILVLESIVMNPLTFQMVLQVTILCKQSFPRAILTSRAKRRPVDIFVRQSELP